ncbi:MAG TPA: tripartite tricarboxylate transporter TctB family protein [Pseudolabrys sp.]
MRGPRDFYGGLALIALAIIALLAAGDLPGQQGFAFGPGTAPRMFATLLAVIGAVVALTGLLVDGEPIGHFAVRGPAYVLVAILLFALMIRGFTIGGLRLPPLGLVPSTFVAFIVSIMGSSEMRWIESLIAAVTMTAFCVLLFVYLLQLPFQLWPWV